MSIFFPSIQRHLATARCRSAVRVVRAFRGACLGLGALPALAQAHVFAQPYLLPVPFALYAAGAVAALALSFVVTGVFATVPHLPGAVARAALPAAAPATHPWLALFRGVAVSLLLLCIVSGLVGTQDAYANVNMTLFWIVFTLGVPYATAIAGDFFAAINPWRAVARGVARAAGLPAKCFEGRWTWPSGLGYAPAIVLYLALIWLELFGRLQPRGLAVALLVYTALNVCGAWAFGEAAWFRRGECFGISLRWIGRLSPRARPWGSWQSPRGTGAAEARDHGTRGKGGAREECVGSPEMTEVEGRRPPAWRWPLVGLLQAPAESLSEVLFIVALLASTAYDGLHATLPWATFYWRDLHPHLIALLAPAPGRAGVVAAQAWYLWQWATLLVSPAVYLGVFVAFVALARAITRSDRPVGALALAFAPSLVPIAFVYNVTHYYTLVLAQGPQLLRIASDPLGVGWNLFGTARHAVLPWMVTMPVVWQTQIALIVAGHVAAVWLAHVEALQCFSTPRRAAVSQLPMLVLMMGFTTLGLWILSLPLAA
ncbi:MAG TPA: hypothetical protein VH328_03665 [Burkholderiaceae bacterium]|nr:hypothetical protein [Burkholderiaceae bacterium]